jgi:hypothetical protein
MPIVITPQIPSTSITVPNPLEESGDTNYLLTFNGRAGDGNGNITPALGDYPASLVNNDSSVSGGTVKDALNTLLAAIPTHTITTQYRMLMAGGASDIDESSTVLTNADGGLQLTGSGTIAKGLTIGANNSGIYESGAGSAVKIQVGGYTRIESQTWNTIFNTDSVTFGSNSKALNMIGVGIGSGNTTVNLGAGGSQLGSGANLLNISSYGVSTGDLFRVEDNGDARVGGKLTVAGDLDVLGTTTTFDSTTVAVGDSMFKYAKDNSADIVDIGYYGRYNDGIDKYTGLFRDASDGKFKMFSGLQVEPTTTVDTGGAGYTVAPLVADLESSNVTITGGSISGITYDSIPLNTGVSPSHSEGLVFYDNVNKCLAYYNDEVDSTMQVGQELWIRAKNNTGVTINNGQVCYLSGVDSGFPTIDLAKADSFSTCGATIGIATHSIEAGTIGQITAFGTTRDIDTSGCSPGDIIYLSATTAGDFTSTNPSSPNFSVVLGNCITSHATTGSAEISINVGSNTRDVIKIFNGGILEDHTIAVTSNGTVVTLSLEKAGGGDLSLFFNGGFTVFASDPAAEVSLTAGSDTAPTINYVYIPESTGVLTVSTTAFPSAQHVPIATVLVQSASSVQTDGCYKVHAWTDHLSDSAGQGHVSHVNHWIRHQHATWLSGVAPTTSITVNGGAIDNVYFSNTSGVVLQLHDHTFPALDMSDPEYVYVVNDSTTAFDRIADLSVIDTDSTGATLRSNNTYYPLVIWGSVNEADADCKLYVNVPSGSYSTASGAQSDVNGYSNYTIPSDFKGTGFLIARVILRYQTAASGTITEVATESLRGSFPSTIAGGGGTGGGPEFSDNLFRITDVADSTAKIAFSATNITTATTRTITMPDSDVTLLQGVTTDTSGNFTGTGNVSIPTAKGFYVNSIKVVGDQQAAMTAQLTTITHTAPGTPDYAMQNMTSTTPFGFVTQDEANTCLSVIANLQTRVAELETKLKAHGLIA